MTEHETSAFERDAYMCDLLWYVLGLHLEARDFRVSALQAAERDLREAVRNDDQYAQEHTLATSDEEQVALYRLDAEIKDIRRELAEWAEWCGLSGQ